MWKTLWRFDWDLSQITSNFVTETKLCIIRIDQNIKLIRKNVFLNVAERVGDMNEIPDCNEAEYFYSLEAGRMGSGGDIRK